MNNRKCTKCKEYKPIGGFIVNLRDEVILTCRTCLDQNNIGFSTLGLNINEIRNYHFKSDAVVTKNIKYKEYVKNLVDKGEISAIDGDKYIKEFKTRKGKRVYLLQGRIIKM